MIRAMVVANNAYLVDSVASILAEELCLDVLQLTYRPPQHIYHAVRDYRSVVIDVDEGQAAAELMIMPAGFRIEDPLLPIRIALQSQNIHVFSSCPLVNSQADIVLKLVRTFCQDHFHRSPADVHEAYELPDQLFRRPILSHGRELAK